MKIYVSRTVTELDFRDGVREMVLAHRAGSTRGGNQARRSCDAVRRGKPAAAVVSAHNSSDGSHGGRSVLGVGSGSPERATCFALSTVTRAAGDLLLTQVINTMAGQG